MNKKVHFDEINKVFEAQKQNLQFLKERNSAQRIIKIERLIAEIKKQIPALENAFLNDLNKSPEEFKITELLPIFLEYKFVKKRLKKWLRPQKGKKIFPLITGKNRILFEPKGTCLIISPWNYPLNLSIIPLISAIAAGNSVILKPSEFSPSVSHEIKKIIETVFHSNEVVVFEGAVETAKELLKKPFDHIFYTGNEKVAKSIMKSAADNLTSITLELGGKSPCLIDEKVNLKNAAQKIAWGKLANSGQTCIAPDYVLIPKKTEKKFIELLKNAFEKLAYQNEKNACMVNKRHFDRIKDLIKNSEEAGAKIEFGNNFDEKNRKIDMTILSNVSEKNPILDEEIFGPILPIISYEKLEDAIEFIVQKPPALVLYCFSKKRKNIKFIQQKTNSGSISINETLTFFANPSLPFGGMNQSGMGNSHGFYGFKAFSNERAYFKQSKYFEINHFFYPPFSKFKVKLINLVLKIID